MQWERTGQQTKDGILYVYKVDRLTGQVWENLYVTGTPSGQFPVISDQKISDYIDSNQTVNFNSLKNQKSEQEKILKENEDARQKFIDQNYEGDALLTKQNSAYMDATNEIDDINAKLHGMASDNLISRAWLIRNFINGIRIIAIIGLVLYLFFPNSFSKLKKVNIRNKPEINQNESFAKSND
jgi:hypothetical protein